jgi:hypothetical protein
MQLPMDNQRRAVRRRSSPPAAPPRSHHRVPWPQQQCLQMGPTMTSCDVCRAAGWALGPRGVASGSFASANILLKSFVEQNGALSTIKRCTGASHLCLCSLPAFATRVPGSAAERADATVAAAVAAAAVPDRRPCVWWRPHRLRHPASPPPSPLPVVSIQRRRRRRRTCLCREPRRP